jgi:hypothetical protein
MTTPSNKHARGIPARRGSTAGLSDVILSVIHLVLLAGCASPTHSSRFQVGKPYDPSIPKSPPGCIPVIVAFAGDEWMDADEMKHKARQRLKQEAHQLDDSYECNITVDVLGRGTFCTATFSKGFGNRIYFVDFDRAGQIQSVRSGNEVEGRVGKP